MRRVLNVTKPHIHTRFDSFLITSDLWFVLPATGSGFDLANLVARRQAVSVTEWRARVAG